MDELSNMRSASISYPVYAFCYPLLYYEDLSPRYIFKGYKCSSDITLSQDNFLGTSTGLY